LDEQKTQIQIDSDYISDQQTNKIHLWILSTESIIL